MDAKLEFSDGIQAWIRCVEAEAYNIFEVDILGETGRYILRDQGHRLSYYRAVDTTRQHGFKQLELQPIDVATDLQHATAYSLGELIKCMEQKRDPVCSVREARQSFETAWQLVQKIPVLSETR